jgi:hypothetical protein
VKCAVTEYANCPGSDAAYKLFSTIDNSEFGDEMTYRQWAMTDCSTLTNVVVTGEEFINDLAEKIWATFHPHGFVAQCQAQVLR